MSVLRAAKEKRFHANFNLRLLQFRREVLRGVGINKS